MIHNFLLSINIILPIVILVFFGIYLKRRNFLDKAFLSSANRLIFYFGIPSMLFINIYQSHITEVFDLEFMIFIFVITLVFIALVWIFAYFWLRNKAPEIIGAFVQGAFRGNITILALPILISIIGNDKLAKVVLSMAVLIPLYNIVAVILLSIHSSNNISGKSIVIGIFKNPVMIGTFAGILVSLFGFTTPVFVRTTLSLLSQMTTPVALICLGAGMTFEGFSNRFKYALFASLLKTMLMPLIFAVVAYLWGFRDLDIVMIVVMGAVPTSISSYVMVVQLDGDQYVGSTNVVLTTVMSGVTMTFWIFVLMELGFL